MNACRSALAAASWPRASARSAFPSEVNRRFSAAGGRSAAATPSDSNSMLGGQPVTEPGTDWSGHASDPSGTPSLSSSASQASPCPSPSASAWSMFGVAAQLSHASPNPSPSVSAWSALGVVGQLSHASPTPSPSTSAWSPFAVREQLSAPSRIPSPSSSASQGLSVPSSSVSGIAVVWKGV
jgi:hypothetical protein